MVVKSNKHISTNKQNDYFWAHLASILGQMSLWQKPIWSCFNYSVSHFCKGKKKRKNLVEMSGKTIIVE